jgi:hypothetical protein
LILLQLSFDALTMIGELSNIRPIARLREPLMSLDVFVRMDGKDNFSIESAKVVCEERWVVWNLYEGVLNELPIFCSWTGTPLSVRKVLRF